MSTEHNSPQESDPTLAETAILPRVEAQEPYPGESEIGEFHQTIKKLHRLAIFLAAVHDKRGGSLGAPSATVEFIHKLGYAIPFSEELEIKKAAHARVDSWVGVSK